LTEVGTVEDGTDPQAVFPGDWVELVAFPEHAIHWIVREGVEVDAE
jgi:hypothetical protein